MAHMKCKLVCCVTPAVFSTENYACSIKTFLVPFEREEPDSFIPQKKSKRFITKAKSYDS